MTYEEILRKYWGYTHFRGIQKKLIESIGAGKDTMGLMPTGGGKSIAFQVPALAMEGVCLVVTPLISLMKDQVDRLQNQHIRAAAIYSGMLHSEMITILENCVFGAIKLLYVSPERLGSELFQAKLKHMNVSFITIDEAHCISQWGYDFRPAYLQIANIRKLVPQVPILALTATATPMVIDDIQNQLHFRTKNVFKMSFERKNVAYVVRKTDNKISELLHILQSVPGTAIVYCRSRDRTKQIAQNIEKFGISATWFHAGLERAEKEQRQNDWQGNKIRVIVATNAFGMGIDKPDVRLVVHADFPSSLEAYFQEAGRVGRDGKKGYAVLLYSPGADERQLKKRGTDTFPPKDYIRTVYNHLAYFYQIGVGSGYGARMEFPIDKFCGIFKHFPIQVNSALHILHRAGYIFYEEDPDTRARVHFLLERDELYRLDALSEKENEVITSLLRNYGGLFSEFRYIDESLLAHEACIERNEAYMILKGLAKKRIIDFIPRKNIPLITYTRDREETSRIVFTKEVYEQIKEQYENQISAIMEYAEKDYICRSRQLLRYFGETKSNDCCICDVCLSSEKQPETKLVKMKKLILGMLSDGKKHLVTELLQFRSKTPEFEKEVISPVLQSMLAEEEIIMDGNYIYISRMRDE